MKLELHQIASYLPYGLRLKYVSTRMVDRLSNKDIIQLKEINEGYIYINGYRTNNKSYIPILRPLSDLDDSQLKSFNFVSFAKDGDIDFVSYDFMKYAFENHFDVFGLIDKGLAIDINTINQ